jgi:hypothetical protein
MTTAKQVKIVMPSADTIAARQNTVDDQAVTTSIEKIRYDERSARFELQMLSGIRLSIPRSQIDEFDAISPDVLKRVSAGIGGGYIELAECDVHISVPGLLRDIFGLNAGQRSGGLARSAAKAAAARANGASGGRPPAASLRTADHVARGKAGA